MVHVVDSSLLTQNPQIQFLSPRWYGTFSPTIVALLILVLAFVLLAAVVCHFICFCAICLQYSVTPSYGLPFCLFDISVGSSTTPAVPYDAGRSSIGC
jgi:hypothetical protein